ncbi:bifunctional methylenetetrahydrofolate dehydrogenase/methenyltetrahydrofolate cyclohydrolase FolD [Oecophyllibacter saccharovorans]|uniref:bifunctional methylenetetrahydrofolate dehydrogenase/methenyltetrahydrofolate cyclohydrolase FolD n=1 Tax=Oecophyllibacter saccharovorans TaxID=2558360 RepID=UPI00116F9569|nr:bifunctional methylenetetrahydrofolate dehydrogenase/methenyltetrahydrofolate cyclohydrolase FolD [Oecophyllibacter saccharovorans]TPW35066.1 bifunctional methylenetetrahydrofolate dehydrogenase/methenyltetrahydrofolate cyclohydrolase FolD [Oecophyllibacter saccharovorans]
MAASPFLRPSPTGGATLIDGKAMANALTREVSEAVAELVAKGAPVPGLAVVLVGNDPASEIYVKNKAIQTHRAGMRSFMHMLPESTTQAELMALVSVLNADPQVQGILVQLPLPPHIDPVVVTNAIHPDKDVDGLGVVNTGRLALGMKNGLVPCTPLGCLMLLQAVQADMTGRQALVIGASNLVGKPMAQLLLQQNCTVTVAHVHTRNLPEICREADIVVVATGKPRLVEGSWIKPGATVIDVGITRLPQPDGRSRLVGDVDFSEVEKVAGYLTPVPGGVGPMTIACLLLNTLKAARLQKKAGREGEEGAEQDLGSGI